MVQLMSIAAAILLSTSFMHSAVQPWDRESVYKQREAELKSAIDARPNDPDAYVALAAFYLKPVAPREIEGADGKVRTVMAPLRDETVVGSIKTIYAVAWVFRGSTEPAKPLLEKALALNKNHHGALRWTALYLRMRESPNSMYEYVQRALAIDPLDLDMARLHLDWHTLKAHDLDTQAALLRAPKISHEDRADGRYEVTRFPSQADLARADALQQQAQENRRQAVVPLRNIAAKLKDDPSQKAKWDLASAVYYCWIGEYGKSAAAANGALVADPGNLDALDFLIEILRATHTKDKYEQYKAIRDRWAGADTTIKKVDPPPARPRR